MLTLRATVLFVVSCAIPSFNVELRFSESCETPSFSRASAFASLSLLSTSALASGDNWSRSILTFLIPLTSFAKSSRLSTVGYFSGFNAYLLMNSLSKKSCPGLILYLIMARASFSCTSRVKRNRLRAVSSESVVCSRHFIT